MGSLVVAVRRGNEAGAGDYPGNVSAKHYFPGCDEDGANEIDLFAPTFWKENRCFHGCADDVGDDDDDDDDDCGDVASHKRAVQRRAFL